MGLDRTGIANGLRFATAGVQGVEMCGVHWLRNQSYIFVRLMIIDRRHQNYAFANYFHAFVDYLIAFFQSLNHCGVMHH
jgi:hypothetical protein